METLPNNPVELAAVLGLEPGADDLFVGKLSGFPVGLKVIDPQGAPLLLFQVRHWLPADAPQFQTVAYDPEVTRLQAEKQLEIELDDRIAWATFTGQSGPLESPAVRRVLESILQAFAKAGFVGDPELCHHCRQEKVDTLTSADGKVAQICPACLEARLRTTEPAATTAELVPIFLMSPLAALTGALLWAAFWVGHSLLFEHLSADKIYLPRIVIVVVIGCMGLCVGGPVGWLIKQNRRRGQAAAASGAILFSVLSVVVGEVFYLAWLLYHEFHVFSLSVAWQVMPEYYLHNDPLFLAWKALAAVVSVVFAYEVAKPAKAPMKL